MRRELINKTKIIKKLLSLKEQGKENIDKYIEVVKWAPCEPTYGTWISIEDEDPTDEDDFLIAWGPESSSRRRFHFYQIAHWDGEQWDFDTGAFNNRRCEVFAWMPLPDQFKGV